MIKAEEIIFSKLKAPPQRPGVYMLLDEGEVVYVGKARFNIRGRIAEHFGNARKEFTDYAYFECDTDEVSAYENALILYHLPRYNKWLPKGGKRLKESKGNG